MALILFNGFDTMGASGYSDQGCLGQHFIPGELNSDFPLLVEGRLGGYAAKVLMDENGSWGFKTNPENWTGSRTYIAGFAYKASSYQVTDSSYGHGPRIIIQFDDWDSPWDAFPALVLYLTNGGEISAYRACGSNPAETRTSGLHFTLNRWYYIEVKIVSEQHGSWELRLNGQTILGETDVDMRPRYWYNSMVEHFWIWTYSEPHYFDDFYVLDGNAGLNDFLGPVRVLALYPSSDTATVQWTRQAYPELEPPLPDHYTYLDEQVPEYEETELWVQSDVANATELLGYPDLTGEMDEVISVWTCMALNCDGGENPPFDARQLAKLDAATAEGDAVTATTDWPPLTVCQRFDEKPGGGAWTVADFNNTVFGFKVG